MFIFGRTLYHGISQMVAQLVSLVQFSLVYISFAQYVQGLRASTKTGFYSLAHTYITHPNLSAQLLWTWPEDEGTTVLKTTAAHITRSYKIPEDLNLQQHCCKFLLVPEYWTLEVMLKLCILFLHESFCCVAIYITILFSVFFCLLFFSCFGPFCFSVVKNGFPNRVLLQKLLVTQVIKVFTSKEPIGQLLCSLGLVGDVQWHSWLHFITSQKVAGLIPDLKDRRGYSHLKEEALDRTMWRNRFGRGFGPVVRQTTE